MNERLTTHDLAERLAAQTGLDRKRAEDFIETISSYFAQSLERNKVVKILGLGMFKIVLVSERESVHIQTQERFMIPAHHKLTYVPDKEFKEQINRPFALFEPVEATESEMLEATETETEIEPEAEIETDAEIEAEAEAEIEAEIEAEAGLSAGNLPEYDIIDDETPEQNAFTDDNLYDEDDFYSEESVSYENEIEEPELNTHETTSTPESWNNEMEYDVISGSYTYPNNAIENEEQAPVSESDGEYTPEDKEELNDSQYNIFTFSKKRKVVLLWFFCLMVPLCLVVGAILGAIIFLHYNTRQDVVQEQVTKNETMTDSDTSMATDLIWDSGDEQTEPELPDNGLSNQDENRSENNPPDTNVTRRQGITPVTDWIAPSSENIRKPEARRVDGPNREIEERNRALVNNTRTNANANANANAARTTAGNTNTSTTNTSTNAKKLPASIKMPAGSTLMQLALEYYDDKVFWVYIYEHNKNQIKDFEKVPAGLELQLPAPQTYGIDAKSPASREKARQKQAQLRK